VKLRRLFVHALLFFAIAQIPAIASSLGATACGEGLASAWFAPRGLEAEVDGSIEFRFLDLSLVGFGYGRGLLDVCTFSGWAWAVAWGRAEPPGEPPVDLVCGFAVEDSSALGSGSVEGTCYLALFRGGARTDYRGTFVTQATSRLVPAVRPGTLALEGQMTLALTLFPCTPTDALPWDSTRWPSELLEDLTSRLRG
jgi:hypothetical protein